MSLTSSFISGGSIVGLPITVYYHGTIDILGSKKDSESTSRRLKRILKKFKKKFLVFPYFISTIITAHVFIPIYHGLKLHSIYEVTNLFSQTSFQVSMRSIALLILYIQYQAY